MRRELPKLDSFVTLSPVPGFMLVGLCGLCLGVPVLARHVVRAVRPGWLNGSYTAVHCHSLAIRTRRITGCSFLAGT